MIDPGEDKRDNSPGDYTTFFRHGGFQKALDFSVTFEVVLLGSSGTLKDSEVS